MTLENLLGEMPKTELRLFEGEVDKHGMDGERHPHILVLTSEALFLASVRDLSTIKDTIPLLEVVEVRSSQSNMEDTGSGTSFEVHFRVTGNNLGVSYIFSCSNSSMGKWIENIDRVLQLRRARWERDLQLSGLVRLQRRVRRLYNPATTPGSSSSAPSPPPSSRRVFTVLGWTL